jgi:hypothetical protein
MLISLSTFGESAASHAAFGTDCSGILCNSGSSFQTAGMNATDSRLLKFYEESAAERARLARREGQAVIVYNCW